MSVSDALVGNLTGLVERAELLKLRLSCSEDETLRVEREEISDMSYQLIVCVKQLQIEVSKLDRRIEDISSKLTW